MTTHQRKCHDCGNVAEHADNVVPEVNCKKCGSQDTRIVREKLPARSISDDDDPCAECRRERDEAVAKLAEARRLLDLSLCDVIPRSGLMFDIEAFLAETQPTSRAAAGE